MKKLVYIAIVVAFMGGLTSCSSTKAIEKEQNELAAYTLKNKKELFQQKLLHQRKNRTVLATP